MGEKTFSAFWNAVTSKVPAFRRPDDADVTLSVRGLRKLAEQAYRAGEKAGQGSSKGAHSYGDIFKRMGL